MLNYFFSELLARQQERWIALAVPLLLAAALTALAAWKLGARIPPAEESESESSGIGGGIVLFLLILACEFWAWLAVALMDAYWLNELIEQVARKYAFPESIAAFWRLRAQRNAFGAGLILDAVPVILTAAVIVRVAAVRKPAVPREVVGLLWLLMLWQGGCDLFFGNPPAAGLAVHAVVAVAGTLYWRESRRVALTYGILRRTRDGRPRARG